MRQILSLEACCKTKCDTLPIQYRVVFFARLVFVPNTDRTKMRIAMKVHGHPIFGLEIPDLFQIVYLLNASE